LHPYLIKENEVYAQCEEIKENLKKELLNSARDLTDQRAYSPIEAKIAANSLVYEKLDKVVKAMKEGTTDVERQSIIENTWKMLSGELYSPFAFKGTLEAVLKGQNIS
jgi:hypothetical protein